MRLWRSGLRTPLRHLLAIVTAAAILLWPAMYNRYPLMGGDTFGYVVNGPRVFTLLFHKSSDILWMRNWLRAEVYSLGLYCLQHPLTPWQPIFFDALLLAWVLWLLVRSIIQQETVAAYLAVIITLSLGTGVGWWVSWLGPDILGPVLYLSLYLLVFAGETLSVTETLGLVAAGAFAITAHASHLAVSLVLIAAFVLLWSVRWKAMAGRGRQIFKAAAVVGLAVAAQITIHASIFGKPSLNGEQAPFLMARALGDGPARLYLETHCSHLNWLICSHVDHLPRYEGDFLWAPGSIWHTANGQQREQLRAEEMPLVRATLLAYPRRQLRVSAANFWRELCSYSIVSFNLSESVQQTIDEAMPGAGARYRRSRQGNSRMPQFRCSTAQSFSVALSLAAAPFVLFAAWRRRAWNLLGLGVVVAFSLVANAAVCGILSGLDFRYQGRVIWLLPLFVLVAATSLRMTPREQRTTDMPPIP